MLKSITPSKITLFLIMLMMTLASANINWSKGHWTSIIEADGKGYYAYLPAIFIYNDLNFGFFDKIEKEKYFNENMYYDYRAFAYDKMINKYYCGTALAELPFFFMGHLSAYLMNFDTDGYSKPYPVFINIAALFYLLLGLIFLMALMNTYGINEWVKSLTLIAAVFGTNLFYYAVGEPAVSHIFSFAFISMFLYTSTKYFSTLQKKYILFTGLLLGFIILIRPVNGLVIFIWPFTAGYFSTFKQGFANVFRHKLWLLYSIILCIGIASIQLIIYKISTGHFIVYSYGEEGFNFLSPHFIDILFSYKKGLFLYTPMYFISLTGLYYVWKSSRFSFYAWAGFFILITYVFSSWWNWYYGGSFSSRIYVEFLSLFMLLLAITLQNIKSKQLKYVYIGLVLLLIVVCQIQTYQYRYYYIHWEEMTKEQYWDVFLRIDKLINK